MTSPEPGTPSAHRGGPPADVVVVGAGPAGLAAVVTAADRGARCVLLDAGAGPGGQYWRRPSPAGDSPVRTDGPPSHRGDRLRRRWLDRLADHVADGRVEVRHQHHVWTVVGDSDDRNDTNDRNDRDDGDDRGGDVGARDGFRLHVLDRSGRRPVQRVVRGRRLVLAPGAYDRQLPFPGWTLPGVMTAGGVQALLKGHGVLPGRRLLVAGTGPFLLPVAADAAAAGAEVVAVCEAAGLGGWARSPGAIPVGLSKLGEVAGYAAALARARIPYRRRHVVVEAHGTDELEAVTVARLDRAGTVDPATRERIAVDTLAVGWGFTPQPELALALGCRTRSDADGSLVVETDDEQRTTVPGVWAAGEVCGVGGAALALIEGELAGRSVADLDLADRDTGVDGGLSREVRRLRRRRAAHRRFAAAMHRAHPLPSHWSSRVTADTVVCRCEEVTADRLRSVVDAGATDTRTAKVVSRAGMGWCQGRICGTAVDLLRAEWTGTASTPVPMATRPVATPVPLGSFVASDDKPPLSGV